MEHEGEVLGIELDLTPAGARSLIGMPARELSDMVVRLDALLRGCSDQLLEELTEARTWEDRFGVIDALFALLWTSCPQRAAKSRMSGA